ncbi:hypothetical protein GCM10009753_30860 [Streptantibioticus ferralitis]
MAPNTAGRSQPPETSRCRSARWRPLVSRLFDGACPKGGAVGGWGMGIAYRSFTNVSFTGRPFGYGSAGYGPFGYGSFGYGSAA